MTFSIEEIAAKGFHQGHLSDITFIVSDKGVIYFTREYTRHIEVARRAKLSHKQVSWGGIVTHRGVWVRKSFDFGDAKNIADRELAVAIISAKIKD